jgi:hypothetical protein
MSAAPAPIRCCRGCECTDRHGCEDGCWWVDLPSELGPLCSECAFLILLVNAGLVFDDDGGRYGLDEMAGPEGLGIVVLDKIAAELASAGAVIPQMDTAIDLDRIVIAAPDVTHRPGIQA